MNDKLPDFDYSRPITRIEKVAAGVILIGLLAVAVVFARKGGWL